MVWLYGNGSSPLQVTAAGTGRATSAGQCWRRADVYDAERRRDIERGKRRIDAGK